jgi:hypothetical protein
MITILNKIENKYHLNFRFTYVIHEALKVWSLSSLNSRAWWSYQLCLEFSEMWLSAHTLWKSKVTCKRSPVIVVLWNKDLIQVFPSLLLWGVVQGSKHANSRPCCCRTGLCIDGTGDHCLRRPWVSCWLVSFQTGDSIREFLISLCYKIVKVLAAMQIPRSTFIHVTD